MRNEEKIHINFNELHEARELPETQEDFTELQTEKGMSFEEYLKEVISEAYYQGFTNGHYAACEKINDKVDDIAKTLFQ